MERKQSPARRDSRSDDSEIDPVLALRLIQREGRELAADILKSLHPEVDEDEDAKNPTIPCPPPVPEEEQ